MDADAIRRETERVRADWAGRGRHWDRRSDELAEQAARMNAPLIEAAGIVAGQQVCDIATGAGEPALSVAQTRGRGRPRLRHRPLPRDDAGRPPQGRSPGAPQHHLPHRRHAGAPGCGCRVRPGGLPLRADVLPGARACRRRGAPRAEARRGGWPTWSGGPRAETTMFVVFVAAVEAVLGPIDDIDEIGPRPAPSPWVPPGALDRAR